MISQFTARESIFKFSHCFAFFLRKNQTEKFARSFICLSLKGKAIGLPDDFLALKDGSKGGGVIQVKREVLGVFGVL